MNSHPLKVERVNHLVSDAQLQRNLTSGSTLVKSKAFHISPTILWIELNYVYLCLSASCVLRKEEEWVDWRKHTTFHRVLINWQRPRINVYSLALLCECWTTSVCQRGRKVVQSRRLCETKREEIKRKKEWGGGDFLFSLSEFFFCKLVTHSVKQHSKYTSNLFLL